MDTASICVYLNAVHNMGTLNQTKYFSIKMVVYYDCTAFVTL